MSSFLSGGVGSGSVRTILTADISYNVATTGSDSNPGTLAQPWATTQHAMDVISSTLDTAGFQVTTNIGAGSFAGFGVKSCLGGGNIYFNGAGAASTTITVGPNDGVYNVGSCIDMNGGEPFALYLNNFTVDGSSVTSGAAMRFVVPGSQIYYNNDPTFAASSSFGFKNCSGLYCLYVASCFLSDGEVGNPVTITGNAKQFLRCINGLSCFFADAYTLVGTPAFSTAFIALETLASVVFLGTFSGAATGKRFALIGNSELDQNTDPAGTYYPGHVAGTIEQGCHYTGITDFIGVVASLPTANIQGTRAFVADAMAATFGASPAGLGALTVPVFNTGAAWKMG